VKAAQANLKFEDVLDPSKVDALLSAFDQLVKSAPSEIKADMNTLNDAIKKERDNVKAGKSPDEGLNASDEAKLTTASNNIEKFAKDKCGIDLNSSSNDTNSDTSFSFSSFTFDSSSFESSLSSLSSEFSSFDSDSFSSELSSACSQFGSDFCSDFSS
jgi:hypothetical protein